MRFNLTTMAALAAGCTWMASVDADERKLKVYYCMYEEQQCVEPSANFEVALDDIPKLARVVLSETEGNFIGFIDADDTTLQFIVSAKGRMDIDFPVAASKGSCQREVDTERAMQVIDTLVAPLLRYKSELDLEFVRWRGSSAE
jgi:hypothetical protein